MKPSDRPSMNKVVETKTPPRPFLAVRKDQEFLSNLRALVMDFEMNIIIQIILC